MTDDTSGTSFAQWLERELNATAEACASHTRQNQEGVPEGASVVHGVLLDAWDAYNYILLLDAKYRPRRELTSFLEREDLTLRSTFEQRAELVDRYFEQRSEADPDAPEQEQTRAVLMAEVRKVYSGTGDGEMIMNVFAQAFREEAFYTEPEELGDGPAAVVYVYDDAEDARSAYDGESKPFDRAVELVLTNWNPLSDDEREILSDLIETQRGVDGHLERHYERIAEKLK